MDSIVSSFEAFISQNAIWAGVILGSITFVESLLIIGAFVPATILLVVAGTLIATGVLDPVNVLIGCVLGAVLGDAVSYEVGRRMGMRVLRMKWLSGHRRKVAWTRLYCRRYGVAAIFIGRFFGPLRAFVPAMVGILQMRHLTFQISNVSSAVVWVLAMVGMGWLGGLGLVHLSEGYGKKVVAIAVVAVVALVIGAKHLFRLYTARRNRLLAEALAID